MSDIKTKTMTVACLDVVLGLPAEREINVLVPGNSYEELAADLASSFNAYRHTMLTTETVVNIAVVSAIAVQQEARRRQLLWILVAVAVTQLAITLGAAAWAWLS